MLVVTGATGHIGNVLIRELLARGQKVRALVMPDDDLLPLKDLPVEIKRGDVTNYSSLLEAFQDTEYVYHLAGIVSIYLGGGAKLYQVNVQGTRNVVKACLLKDVKRLLFTSSIHAFPELPHGEVLTEHKNFNEKKVVGHYAKSKALATKEVLEAGQKGLDVVVVHPTGVIGPYEYSLSNMGQLIFDFLHGRLLVRIDGCYDFVDVRDAVEGIISACEKGRTGENYILSGEQITIKEIFEHLEQITGKSMPGIKMPIWFARITAPLAELYYRIVKQKPLFTAYSIHTLTSNSLTSSKKAREELGYNPRPIRESLSDTVNWLKMEKIREYSRR